jgi:hypothetical protein
MTVSLNSGVITVSGTESSLSNFTTANGATRTAFAGITEVDAGSNAVQVAANASLTINAATEILKSANTIELLAGSTLLVTGDKTVNSKAVPVMRTGIRQVSTSKYGIKMESTGAQSVLEVHNASVSIDATGSGVMTVIGSTLDNLANISAKIKTSGAFAYIGKGGTGDKRLRLLSDTEKFLDFQADKTYVELWVNLKVVYSLKGFTPVGCDGPEIQPKSSGATELVVFENFDPSLIVGSYYPNAKMTIYAGSYVRLLNAPIGTNMPVTFQAGTASAKNTLEYAKRINAKIQDSVGNALQNALLIVVPTGTAPAGVRPAGHTSDIAYSMSPITATSDSAGAASLVFVYGVSSTSTNDATSASAATLLSRAVTYLCSTTTKGSEAHNATISVYGYEKKTINVTLAGSGDANLTATLASLPTTDKVAANAQAISGVSFAATASAVTVSITANITAQQIYDAWIYQASLSANHAYVQTLITIADGVLNITGSLTTSAAISSGGNVTRGIKARQDRVHSADC